MTLTLPTFRPIHLAVALAFAAFGAVLAAQVERDGGMVPVAPSGDFEVTDIHVDIYGANAEIARQTGWKLAQRLAWRKLWRKTNGAGAPELSDQVLDGLVAGIEVQQEEIGPNRYIATLGVQFDRARAGQALGVTGQIMRSSPLLVLPVLIDSGVSTGLGRMTEWQKAWATFRTGESPIDYVRTAGDGPDSMLLTAAQSHRRGRSWWRVLLEEYGAANVIMPLARLDRTWPGGPVTGHFAARHGPDNTLIGTFDLHVDSSSQIPQMMADAVKRMDDLYSKALLTGILKPDASLVIEKPVATAPAENAGSLGAAVAGLSNESSVSGPATFTLQVDTPTAASVSGTESALRAIPGVKSAGTTSLALGGTSIMQLSYDGPANQLRAALEARGYAVAGSGTTLRISRGRGRQ